MISSVMLRLTNLQVRMQDPEAQEVSGERMAVRRADIRSITLKAAVWMIFLVISLETLALEAVLALEVGVEDKMEAIYYIE